MAEFKLFAAANVSRLAVQEARVTLASERAHELSSATRRDAARIDTQRGQHPKVVHSLAGQAAFRAAELSRLAELESIADAASARREQAEVNLADARARMKALEKLRTKFEREERAKADRAEQQEMSDTATQRWLRQKGRDT